MNNMPLAVETVSVALIVAILSMVAAVVPGVVGVILRRRDAQGEARPRTTTEAPENAEGEDQGE